MEEQAKYNVVPGAAVGAQERAILHLLQDDLFDRLLRPVCAPREGDFSKGITDIFFARIEAGVLSGGEQAALAWAAVIWKDSVVKAFRDPFEGFSVINPRRQALILEAFRIRHEVDEAVQAEERFMRVVDGAENGKR